MKQRIEGAFDEIYEKYAKMLYGYILQLCKNPTTADDILQTVFLKAIEHADSFEGKCEVSTWLCQIAKNTWLDMCKRAEQKMFRWITFWNSRERLCCLDRSCRRRIL